MATVFYMKFNEEQGALISDEMSWHLSFKYGYRPSRYADSILNLVDENTASENNFAAVYAGVGFPSLHYEIARKAKDVISKTPGCIGDLEKTSAVTEDIYQEAIGRMLDDKLKFFFGFDRDQLNDGKFEMNGKTWDIKQEAVISEARRLLKYQDKSDAFKRIFDNEGLVMGYDRSKGIRAFALSNESRDLDFAYNFGAIGIGKEIGTKLFADVNYRMQLEERRKGFEFKEGLFFLLYAFAEACDFQVRVGGNAHIFIIDAKRQYLKNITSEIHDHSAHLATEITRAYRWGYLNKEDAQGLIDRALLDCEDWKTVESDMFKKSSDSGMLRKYLAGYKPAAVPKAPMK